MLAFSAFAPALTRAEAATPTVLNIGAVFAHPIQSLDQINQPYPGFFLYYNGGVMALWDIYPAFLFGNGTYVNDGLISSTDTITANNTYIVHLRNDTGWSNGQPVTAWDMYASLMAVNGLGSPPYLYKVINNYTLSIQVPNDPKLGINGINIGSYIYGPDVADVPIFWNYNQWKPVVDDIAGNFTQILAGNTTVLSALTAEEAAHTTPMVFNGPYYPVSVTSSEILLQKNPHYFDAAKITVPQIIIHQYTTPSALYQALTSGQIDFYFGGTTINDDNGAVVPTQYQAVMPSYMQQIPSNGYTGPTIFFNNNTVPLDERQAIAYVLNRTEVAAAGGVSYSPLKYPDGLSLNMYGNGSTSICNSACEGTLNPYNQDMNNATSLMQAAGFKLSSGAWTYANGTKLTLTLLNAQSTDATWLAMALDIQSQLSGFGISVNLDNPANPTSIALTGKGFDMYMTGFGWFPTAWDIFRPAYIYDGTPYPVMHATSNVTVPINNIGKINQITLFRISDNAKNQTALVAADDELAWLVDHYLTYLPIAETNPIAYLNTHDFTWPAASSPVWSVIIANDPGAAIVVAEQAGQLTSGSGTSSSGSTTTSSSGSSTSVTTSVTNTSATNSTSQVNSSMVSTGSPTTASSTITATTPITTTASTITTISSTSVAPPSSSSTTTTTTPSSSSTALNNSYFLVIAAVMVATAIGLATAKRRKALSSSNDRFRSG
jgi:peptide/nickel transport system substrate-binding protein